MKNHDWKTAHANESEKALEHPLVRSTMEEFACNMGFSPDVGLPAYGLMKVAAIAAQVARAQALGFDPDLLRMSPDEANAQLLAIGRRAVANGAPVLKLDEFGATRLD